MSWITRIESIKLEIITGDGKSWFPEWNTASKKLGFHTKGYDFIDIDGTFVERKKKIGKTYPLLLYFQGENHLETIKDFENSVSNTDPWTIKHPLYDDLTVQPLDLEFNNSSPNISIVSGTVWETISQQYPSNAGNIKVTLTALYNEIVTLVLEVYTNDIGSPSVGAVAPAQSSTIGISENYRQLTGGQTLQDLTRTAANAATNILSKPAAYIEEAQKLINYPFIIEQNLSFKVEKIIDGIDDLFNVFIEGGADQESYIMYEANVTTLLSQACLVAVFPEDTDYKTSSKVLDTADTISTAYNTFIETLDDISFNQNETTAFQLDSLINQTLANLFLIAFSAKQERTIYINEDSNIVLLANQYFGEGDQNLIDFIEKNSISINEYIQIKAGRKITYLV